MAEFTLSEWGGAQVEHNSNVFEVADRKESLLQNGTPEVADTIARYQGGGQLEWRVGQQRLLAVAEGAKVQYRQFEQLDHYEHHWGGQFDWKLSDIVDGQVEYRDDRRLASFADVDTSVLTLQTDRAALASLNVLVAPSWRVETGAQRHESKLPLPNAREFKLTEDSGHVGVKYVGADKLSAGLVAEGARGEYSGLAAASTYDQYGLKLAANYVVSDLSKLESELGAVQRTEHATSGAIAGDDQKVTELEGKLAYKRELSGKTSTELELFRRVESYVAGANALVDTGLAAALSWKPTDKIVVNGRAGWSQSAFKTGAESSQGRKDEYLHANLEVSYRALDWLLWRAFSEYRDRNSNIRNEDFAVTVGGLELRLQFQQ
ncbi:MAG TPA: outer membrane beta-barrel protein [Solimonas sp.]|nr:outer membrane beta-barrel protein [Solimonas sp.]